MVISCCLCWGTAGPGQEAGEHGLEVVPGEALEAGIALVADQGDRVVGVRLHALQLTPAGLDESRWIDAHRPAAAGAVSEHDVPVQHQLDTS